MLFRSQTMLALSSCSSSPNEHLGRADEAARRLVLRLVELSGGDTPDWQDDESLFYGPHLIHARRCPVFLSCARCLQVP